jgi:hypothetical protein
MKQLTLIFLALLLIGCEDTAITQKADIEAFCQYCYLEVSYPDGSKQYDTLFFQYYNDSFAFTEGTLKLSITGNQGYSEAQIRLDSEVVKRAESKDEEYSIKVSK